MILGKGDMGTGGVETGSWLDTCALSGPRCELSAAAAGLSGREVERRKVWAVSVSTFGKANRFACTKCFMFAAVLKVNVSCGRPVFYTGCTKLCQVLLMLQKGDIHA